MGFFKTLFGKNGEGKTNNIKSVTECLYDSDGEEVKTFGKMVDGKKEGTWVYSRTLGEVNALVNFKERQNEEVVDDIKVEDIRGEVRIKVEQDCRDYIKNNGKTQSIVVQGKNYNVITDDGTREYLGQKYFVFYLEATT